VHHDILFYADGSFIVDEEVIPAAGLPVAVRKSIQTAYPKGTIELAEKLSRPSETGYEVVVKSGSKTYEVELDASGKVVNTEEKTGKEKD
jgi:hypothetical protein